MKKRATYEFSGQNGTEVRKICIEESSDVYYRDVRGRLCAGASDAVNARIFDSGAILHSARAGMATGDVDSDSAVKSRYFYDHHAVFLFLNRTDTRANVG